MQRRSSKNTAGKQIPAIVKKVDWVSGTHNLDFGSGPNTYTTMFLNNVKGVVNHCYDPYNLALGHNDRVVQELMLEPADSAVVANVLNVIDSAEGRREAIHLLSMLVKPGAPVYISIHIGDGTGIGRETKQDCWQNNQLAPFYLREVCKYLEVVKVTNNKIIARRAA